MCASVVHVLGIVSCAWRWFSVSVSSASNEDYNDDPPLNKLCVFLCMPQNAPECTSEHLKLPKFPGGACPPDPPRVKDCRAAMFSTSFAPPNKRNYVRPWYTNGKVVLEVGYFCLY